MTQVPITHDEMDELIQRYEKEREKRLNKAGLSQYIDVRSEEIQDLAKDPWVDYNDPRIRNPPLKDGSSIKFLISGAGHNGILLGCRLVEAGFSGSDVVCVDIAGGFGGTWYWNRYPGLMCDVESYCYLPLLEETGYIPKHKYSFGAEIRGQNERAAKHFGIQGQFCTKIESQIWDHDEKVWVVTMTRTFGENTKPETITVFADFVMLAGGILNIPKIPKLPGWQEFRNNKRVFHSARWDYDYTGGNQEQPDLVKLKDKTVAIIGTGATALQIVPELAKWAKHLYVIQRTPSYCGYRGNRLTDIEHFKSLSKEKGWQNSRRLNFNSWITNNPGKYGPNLVNDGWTHTPAGAAVLGSNKSVVGPQAIGEHIKYFQTLDRPRTDLLRKRVDDVVKDKDTAEKLKPWYGSWCKRPAFHDDYLEAFNQSNVTLIDTDGKGLEAFSENGFVFGGQEYEIDALILATGFTVSIDLDASERLSAVIKGDNGETMSRKFQTARNPPIFGVAMTNFPNLFGYLGPGSAGSWNFTSVYDAQAKYIAQVLKKAHMLSKDGQKVFIEVDPVSEETWGNEIAKHATWFSILQTCTPGYFTSEGEIRATEEEGMEKMLRKARFAVWGPGIVDYQERLEASAAKPGIEHFDVSVLA
ncbi:Pyr-redox-3 multi-domain protein [Pyrenophora tritici-repentis]|uniref:Flavin-binding monooxygenase n=2 Tax=Pyrenophora tritici-repentis TaxID=45151 RepID=A0A2W1E443_9PLEO|nr:cyclohexanone 1,2-monooxygenase [Pyrenophora tritici-repentis Pt-1C-BFP]KAA8619707.1 cyclohexanone 1 2-monooxygenase [Pyrenophora tritici-repentis]EDU47043.1 cyclohexanone 1,2-monooxygenase [Pyrenophora tritici-repentis Pt-1C-BFP]KAF7447848.1 cyclohexanone 1-2-monooxygenase [Pyrenophora tritici-repentis]KAF7571549.1 Pyr-redox-3 multi-domain protein [Pyrenophora tritici-repentis]KAG9385225.1 cyclohexanone 1,2-monooxygenase [Pyrenophora tritici-repentis]